MKKNSKLSGLYLGILFFLMYLPIGVVVVFSFNEARLPVRFTGFSLKWYQELFQDRDLIQALKNSLILAVSSCGVSAVIGTLGAVGLSRIHWKTKGVMEYISILPLMIPEIILGMVLMAFFYMLNLPFGMLTLLIGHTVFCVPYILMEVKARLVGMDPSLEEAARDLGAGSFRAFWDITLPLIMPAVLSGCLLAQAQKSVNIDIGSGMVTIALASLLIGSTILGRGGIFLHAVGAVLGAVVFRLVYTVALRLDMPAFMLKLVSAVIVVLAISIPYLRTRLPVLRRRMQRKAG